MALIIRPRTPKNNIGDTRLLNFLLAVEADWVLNAFEGDILLSNKDTDSEDKFEIVFVEPLHRRSEIRAHLRRNYLEFMTD